MNLTEQEYHDYPAWSYSTIARYARKGFSALATLHDKVTATPEMEFGSLVDSLVTRGIEETKKEYVVSDAPLPTPQIKEFYDALLKQTNAPLSRVDEELMRSLWSEISKNKFDSKRADIYKAQDYYDLCRSGKKVISSKDKDDAMQMYYAIKDHKYIGTLFDKSTKDVEYLYQLQLCRTMCDKNGVEHEVKCMFDCLKVDHKDKTLQPIDLKTSSMPGYDFADHWVKMRYDLQARLYSDVLNDLLSSLPEYVEYTILPFIFVDISRSDMTPVAFDYPQFDFSQENGLSIERNGKEYQYKGWPELLAEIVEYESTQAVVPSYITTEGPNDLLALISKDYND